MKPDKEMAAARPAAASSTGERHVQTLFRHMSAPSRIHARVNSSRLISMAHPIHEIETGRSRVIKGRPDARLINHMAICHVTDRAPPASFVRY
jgi:hypothetical protein